MRPSVHDHLMPVYRGRSKSQERSPDTRCRPCSGGSSRKTRPAPATACGVGVLEDEPSPHDLILEVDGCAVEVEQALGIAHDPDPVLLKLLIGLLLRLGQ